MQNARRTLALLFAMGTIFSSTARADYSVIDLSPIYIGVDVGQFRGRQGCDAEAGTTITSCEKTNTSGRAYLGWKFTPYLSVEAGYVNFGRYSISGTVNGLPVDAKLRIQGIDALAVGTLPIGDLFALSAKVGAISWGVRENGSAPSTGATASENAKGVSLTFGLNGSYRVTKQVDLHLGWQRYRNVGNNNTTGSSDFDFIYFGPSYAF